MIKPDIIFQDEHIIVANKPPQLLSIPDRFDALKPSLSADLTVLFGKIFIVHRLDRETSGIIVFAKTEEAHRHLSIQFENHETQKVYLALVDGVMHQDEGEIDRPIAEHPTIPGKMMVAKKGKESFTLYTVIERFKHFTLVEADIRTGRTHQIRVHFQSLGYPLAVDALYGRREALFGRDIKNKFKVGKFTEEELPLMKRISLHSHRLTFKHPLSNEYMSFETELPKDFRATINQLRKWGK
jgi:23S rRNA pseudouridine1911/1915/1917 synthase